MNLYRPLQQRIYISYACRMMHDRRLPSVMGEPSRKKVEGVKSPKRADSDLSKSIHKSLKEIQSRPGTPRVISNIDLMYLALNDRED